MKWLASLFCKHDWTHLGNIYGDEIIVRNWNRSEWMCSRCGKGEYRKFLYRASEGGK